MTYTEALEKVPRSVEVAAVIITVEAMVVVDVETAVGSSKMIKMLPIMPVVWGKTVKFRSVSSNVKYKVLY